MPNVAAGYGKFSDLIAFLGEFYLFSSIYFISLNKLSMRYRQTYLLFYKTEQTHAWSDVLLVIFLLQTVSSYVIVLLSNINNRGMKKNGIPVSWKEFARTGIL